MNISYSPRRQKQPPKIARRAGLVLSRGRNQRIRIGTDIWISVVDIRGDKVRLGIDAPPSVQVMREELIHDGA